MVYGVTLWALMSLISISLVGYHPLVAIGVGAIGGIVSGILLWKETSSEDIFTPKSDKTLLEVCRPQMVNITSGESFIYNANNEVILSPSLKEFFRYSVLWVLRAELILLIPAIIGLLLSKHLPYMVPALSVMSIFFLVVRRWWNLGYISVPTPFDIPIFILFLLPASVGLYVSSNFQSTLSDVFGLGAGIVLFYFLVNNARSEERLMVVVCGVVIVGALGAFGVLWVMEAPHIKLPILGWIFLQLPDFLHRRINPNYVGGLLVFFLPLSFWVSKNKKNFWIVGAIGMIVLALLLTQSRGALLGVVLALVCTIVWQFGGFRWMSWILITGICLLAFWGRSMILGPFGTDGNSFVWGSRSDLWQWAIYILQDFPFTGIGLHSFPLVVENFYPLFDIAAGIRVPHAHSLFLQIAVDLGIPGFVAFWMLLGIWGCLVWESLKRTQAGLMMAIYRPWVLGVAGGMIAHLIYGIMDTIALGEIAGIVFWLNLALTVSLWRLIRIEEFSGSHE